MSMQQKITTSVDTSNSWRVTSAQRQFRLGPVLEVAPFGAGAKEVETKTLQFQWQPWLKDNLVVYDLADHNYNTNFCFLHNNHGDVIHKNDQEDNMGLTVIHYPDTTHLVSQDHYYLETDDHPKSQYREHYQTNMSVTTRGYPLVTTMVSRSQVTKS